MWGVWSLHVGECPLGRRKRFICEFQIVVIEIRASKEDELPSLPHEAEPDYDETLEWEVEIKLPAAE